MVIIYTTLNICTISFDGWSDRFAPLCGWAVASSSYSSLFRIRSYLGSLPASLPTSSAGDDSA